MTSHSSFPKNYPLVQITNEEDLDENSSPKKQLYLIGKNKRVVDFGCATGYFAQFLKQKECSVVGVELNPEAAKIAKQYCEQVIVADLDLISIPKIFPEQKFDVAVFGDVLEHLRDPWRVLEEARQILQPDGYVVASIPNIAHGAVRLALLQGRFEYVELGLLDNTHLRFFTRKTVQELFERAGYLVDVIDRTIVSPFSGSPWVPSVELDGLSDELIRQIEQAEDADTLQFVVRAFPLTLEGKYAALHLKYSDMDNKNCQLELDLLNIKDALELCRSQLQNTQIELQNTQVELQNTQVELQNTQVELQNTQVELVAMESSKFWKLRKIWFQLRESWCALLGIGK